MTGVASTGSGQSGAVAPRRSDTALKVAGFGMALGVAQKALSETRIVASVLTNPAELGLSRALILERPGQVAAGLAMMKSWNAIVPPSGGVMNAWGKAFTLSQFMKSLAIPATFFLAATNMPDGWKNGGPAGLVGSKSGRSGVIATAGSVAQIAFFAHAAQGMGGHGVGQAIRGTLGNPWLSSKLPICASVGVWSLFMLNEVGMFDSLNTGNTKSIGETVSGAGSTALSWVKHPTQYFRQSK